MPSPQPKKQVERFKTSVYKFADDFAGVVGAEQVSRNENARNGITTVRVTLRTVQDGVPATRAAKIGSKMASLFDAWFAPTHFEKYDSINVEYMRGEGVIKITGRI